jgi:hypothetical protein
MIAMLAHSVNEKGQREVALANAAFLTAAPAMAEALVDLLDAHKDDKDDAWCRASHKAALEALLAAGYTIKD